MDPLLAPSPFLLLPPSTTPSWENLSLLRKRPRTSVSRKKGTKKKRTSNSVWDCQKLIACLSRARQRIPHVDEVTVAIPDPIPVRRTFTTVWGIDMSVSNPALCRIHLPSRTLHLYGMRNRQMEKESSSRVTSPDSPFHQWKLVCHLWAAKVPKPPTLPTTTTRTKAEKEPPLSVQARFQRYRIPLQQIISLLCVHTPPEERAYTCVGIEHYSYNSQSTFATSTLYELGTLLRSLLLYYRFSLHEFSPSMVKLAFSDAGAASKDDMYTAYRTRYHLPCLYTALSLPTQTYKHVPHPLEDMVDALAVSLCTLRVTDLGMT